MFGGLACATIGYFSWNVEYIQFDSGIFYLLLLPVLIFNSGIELNITAFYQNFLAIMVYANIGTIINAVVVAAMMYYFGYLNFITPLWLSEAISFGALISATDPVTTIAVFECLHVEPQLYAIVVGVSVLDDAVSVLIFDLVKSVVQSDDTNALSPTVLIITFLSFLYKFLGSLLLGYALGLGYAYFLKCHGTLIEQREMVYVCMSLVYVYLVYLIADVCFLSGIITTMLAGISFRTYLEIYNPDYYLIVKGVMNQVSYALECFVFAYIGFTLPSHPLKNEKDWIFTCSSIFACFVGRIAQIYPLAWILNTYNRMDTDSIGRETENETVVTRNSENSRGIQKGMVFSFGQQHMMLLAGLRGPIAYATAQLFENSNNHMNLIAGATGITVLATTFFYGALTIPALDWFGIRYGKTNQAIESQTSQVRHQQLLIKTKIKSSNEQDGDAGDRIMSTNDFLFSSHGNSPSSHNNNHAVHHQFTHTHSGSLEEAETTNKHISSLTYCNHLLSQWFEEFEEMVLLSYFLDQTELKARQYASLNSLGESASLDENEDDAEVGITFNTLITESSRGREADENNHSHSHEIIERKTNSIVEMTDLSSPSSSLIITKQ